jgi:ABC-type phosphate transport system substrate-binding protein
MRIKLGRLIALLAVCVGAAFAVAAPTASAAETKCVGITGSGSSFQANAQETVWSPLFKKAKNGCLENGPEVKYISTSSGKGLECWGDVKGEEFNSEACGTKGKIDAFIGTDVGAEGGEGGQIKKIDKAGGGNHVITVPVAAGAIAVIVSLPVSCAVENTEKKAAHVEAKPLEQEWLKAESKFSALIKNVTLKGAACEEGKIKREARESSSGTTAGFKRFLNAVDKAGWELFVATAAKAQNTEWPEPLKNISLLNAKGKILAETVFKTANTIGYADLADAVVAGFSSVPTLHKNGTEEYYSFYVEVQNNESSESKTFASPVAEFKEGKPLGSNCATAKFKTAPLTNGLDTSWSSVEQTERVAKSGKAVDYPICSLTYDTALSNYKLVKEFAGNAVEVENTLKNYLTTIIGATGQGELLTNDHYSSFPKELKLLAEEGIKLI